MEIAKKLFLKVEDGGEKQSELQDDANDDLLNSDEPRNDKSLDDDLLETEEKVKKETQEISQSEIKAPK